MPKFSRRSLNRLRTCDPRLRALFERVVETYDCTIICGHRGETAQNAAADAGRSQKRWPDGKHNSYPSKAVDVGPWPLDWNDKVKFYHLAGYVQAIAEDMGVPIRWGGDWDSDLDLHDQTLYDLGHFEIKEP
jgi:hypothetical protein